jgi:DNA gyrase subunit A
VIRVHSGEIREAGRSTQGVRLLRLDEGDRVVAAAAILEEENGAIPVPEPEKK